MMYVLLRWRTGRCTGLYRVKVRPFILLGATKVFPLEKLKKTVGRENSNFKHNVTVIILSNVISRL